jgi:hypothetical protein
MKTIKKNVYYCDHCGKRGMGASAMTKHEKHCTLNPNRECRLCIMINEVSTPSHVIRDLVEKYKNTFEIVRHEESFGFGTSFKWKFQPVTPNDILNDVDGCPACALTIARLSGLTASEVDREEFNFDFQKEMQSFWADRNKEEWEKERREMSSGGW